MTIQSTAFRASYSGNGGTTVFPFAFQVPSGQYLEVTYVDAGGNATLLSPSLYSVVFSAGFLGGSVTYPLTGSPIATGTTLTIARNVPLLQQTSLLGQGSFNPQVVESALDTLCMEIQQISGSSGLAITVPLTDVAPVTQLPSAAARANKYFGFDGLGNPAMLTSSSATLSLLNVADFGAHGGGVIDEYTSINAGMVAAAATGSGLYFPPGIASIYKHGTALMQKNHVVLWGAGVTLLWGGGASPQITSPTSACLIQAGIVGINLNSGGASKSIELFSPWNCVFRDMSIATANATSFVMDFLCNSTGATNPDGNYNGVFNHTENILQTGTCGTFIRLRGTQVGGAPADQAVTDNTFCGLYTLGCAVRGIDFSRWCDSNEFSGMVRLCMTASNAVGVEFGSNAPLVDEGTYSNNFEHLAVDTFAIGGVTGRVGFKMNSTKFNKIVHYYNEPVAEGGSYIISSLCQSFDFTENLLGVMYHRTTASMMALGAHDMDVGTAAGSAKDFRMFAGGTMQARARHDITAVNWIDFFGAIAGASVIVQAEGASTNVGMLVTSKGNANVILATNQNSGGKNIGLLIGHIANGVNYWTLFESPTGSDVVARVAGDDTNINASIQSKGTGVIVLGSDSAPQVKVLNGGGNNANNVVTLKGNSGGNPQVGASGGSLEVASPVVFTSQTVGTTVGGAGGATALPATPLGYITTTINGTAVKIPYYTP